MIVREDDVCRNGLRAGCPACARGKCTAPREDVVALVADWIRDNARPRTTIRRRAALGRPASSYGWKHLAERALGWPKVYVANGEFIAAALRAGVRAVPVADRSPNAFFAMEAASSPCADPGAHSAPRDSESARGAVVHGRIHGAPKSVEVLVDTDGDRGQG